MHRTLTALAVALALIFASVVPASAATWIQFRYWSTTTDRFRLDGATFTWDSPMGGISVRRDFGPGNTWALSFNFDRGSINNWTGAALGTGPYNQFWNLNLHRNFMMPNGGRASVYVGYFGANWEAPNFAAGLSPAGAYVRQTGWRLGVDAMVPFASRWYVSGDLGYAFNQSATQQRFTTVGPQSENASLLDWRVALGYNLSTNWSVEGGYRAINWTFNPSPMCFGSSPCDFRWDGWFAGLNWTMP